LSIDELAEGNNICKQVIVSLPLLWKRNKDQLFEGGICLCPGYPTHRARERRFQRAKRKNLFRIIAPIQLSVCSSFILSAETRKIPKTSSLQFRGVFFLPSQQEDWKGGKKVELNIHRIHQTCSNIVIVFAKAAKENRQLVKKT
jgi:hypothetical protein